MKNKKTMVLVVVILIVLVTILFIENPLKKNKSGSSIVKEEAVEVKSALGTAISDRAPNIVLNDLDSKPVLLSDYKGKKNVIVNFWASWCSHVGRRCLFFRNFMMKIKTN